MLVLVAWSCPTLCDPMDYSPPGFSSMEFSREEYWSGLPFHSPGHLPDPGIEPQSPELQADPLPNEPPGKPWWSLKSHTIDEIRISFIWFDSGVEVLNHPTTCFNVCLLLCLPQVPLAVCWSLWTPSQNLFLCVHKIQRITKNKRHLQWNTLISLLEKQIYDMVV